MAPRRSVLALAAALIAALLAAPAPALAADGQIEVSVPTEVPCYVSASGKVTAPSNWEIRNDGSEEVSLGDVAVEPGADASATISAASSVDGADKSTWFSWANGSLTQAKTGEQLAVDKTVKVDWTVGGLGREALEGAADGGFSLARVTFTFVQKPRAFAVLFTDGTAKLYKRACALPAAGDEFDGGTVSRVVDGIENRNSIFNRERALKSVSVVDPGIRPVTTYEWFMNCTNLTSVDLSKLDFSADNNMAEMFSYCSSLATLDASEWDTSKVQRMGSMFKGCRSLTTLDVPNWDTSSVTVMRSMFSDCSSLASLDVSGWDTSSVEDMDSMFNYCTSLAAIDVKDWDTSKVTAMANMFYYCSSLASLDVSGWDTSSVKNMYSMFAFCSKLVSLDVSGWDTSSVTNMDALFYACAKLSSINVEGWDTSKVTDMTSMFRGCSSLSTLDVSKWSSSEVTRMDSMFYGCSSLVFLDVSGWDTSEVTSMDYMFNGCSSLRSLTVGTGFSLDWVMMRLPVTTVYTADGAAVALTDIPKGVAATYYTKLEYVPQQPAGDEPAAAPASAVQGAMAAVDTTVNAAANSGDPVEAPVTDGSALDAADASDSGSSADDGAVATQAEPAEEAAAGPSPDTQPALSLAA